MSEPVFYIMRIRFQIVPDLTEAELNQVIDDFILEAIEENGLQFGGGGREEWEGVAEPAAATGTTITKEQREYVASWLDAHPLIGQVDVGEIETLEDT